MAQTSLAIVIPCHNEAGTIADVVRGATSFGDVFVVDDRSTDDSAALAQAAGARVISARASGYDGALETGLRYCMDEGYERFITIDADGEHDPRVIRSFVAAFDAGAPLVCGVRVAPQRAAEYIAAAFGARAYGLRDLLCGMKGYTRPVLTAYFVINVPFYMNMTPAILWRTQGGTYVQVPVTGARRIGQPRFGRSLAANRAILITLYRAARLPTNNRSNMKS
jgi:glycosyltransferase involved in cell wall biosynthesis